MVPRAGLDVMKSKISHPYRESNPDSSVAQPIAYSLYRLLQKKYSDQKGPEFDSSTVWTLKTQRTPQTKPPIPRY
jgi:hypothetical protein